MWADVIHVEVVSIQVGSVLLGGDCRETRVRRKKTPQRTLWKAAGEAGRTKP